MFHRRLGLALLVAVLSGCAEEPARVVPLVRPVGAWSVDTSPSPRSSSRFLTPDGHLHVGGSPDALPPSEVPKDRIFRWAEGGLTSMDPHRVSGTVGFRIVTNVFENLVVHGPRMGAPVPGAAERYEVSPDARVWTFHLRREARWSDGHPVTAHDFVAAWERCLRPETAAKTAFMLWKVVGAKAYNTGELKDFDEVGIRALDDWTLEVSLIHPVSYFPHLLTLPAFAPVPRWAIARHGDRWTRPEHIVVNGPFTLQEWKARDRVWLAKNPSYWDAENVWLQGGEMLFSESESTAWRLYEEGRVHWLPGVVPMEKISALIAQGRPDFYIDPLLCVYYYSFRVDRPPFDDVRIRRAFNQALDKERIVQHVTRAGQLPATHLVPEAFADSLGYRGPEGDPLDPVAAQRVLTAAGYPKGVGLSGVELVYNTSEQHLRIAEIFQRDLADALGVDIRLHNMEWKSALKRMRAGDFQVARTSWCADYPDPMSFLEVFHSENASNYGGYQNPAYDALLARIDATSDVPRRNQLIREAENLLNQDQPILPIYFYTTRYMLKPFVRGLEPHALDAHPLKYIRFSGEEDR